MSQTKVISWKEVNNVFISSGNYTIMKSVVIINYFVLLMVHECCTDTWAKAVNITLLEIDNVYSPPDLWFDGCWTLSCLKSSSKQSKDSGKTLCVTWRNIHTGQTLFWVLQQCTVRKWLPIKVGFNLNMKPYCLIICGQIRYALSFSGPFGSFSTGGITLTPLTPFTPLTIKVT